MRLAVSKPPNGEDHDRGSAILLVVLIIGLSMMVLAAVSVNTSLSHAQTHRGQQLSQRAREIANSAAAQAIARLRDGGRLQPVSGGGPNAVWTDFGEGQFYYYTLYSFSTESHVVRAWGRVPVDDDRSNSSVAPDDASWDGTGWLLRGLEISVKGNKYLPKSPAFFGNGGVERPMGGFEWAPGVDPANPSTWVPITHGASSWQSSSVPFQMSSLDHPFDYLYNGGTPTPATTNPHPFSLWTSQNPIGQFNVEAWFANSAGNNRDPTVGLSPAPTSTYYNVTDKTSPDYPYPVLPNTPDVQDLSEAFWNTYKDDSSVTKLDQGQHWGTFGDLTNPAVTIVTGKLTVPGNKTFKGCGVLVIRDDYDANVDTNNTPSKKSSLTVNGTLEWTGLVIIAGWAPTVRVNNNGNATIVGSLFGEDTVQSGGEVSLDSATIIFQVNNDFRLLYSSALFDSGGILYSLMPSVAKEIVGIRDI